MFYDNSNVVKNPCRVIVLLIREVIIHKEKFDCHHRSSNSQRFQFWNCFKIELKICCKEIIFCCQKIWFGAEPKRWFPKMEDPLENSWVFQQEEVATMRLRLKLTSRSTLRIDSFLCCCILCVRTLRKWKKFF